MDYGKAQDIRKKGLVNLITENIVGGQGIGSSFGSAISDRTKATFTGIKESFDPMNIAKKLTGGSKLASALVGRMTGRSQEDIEHFAGSGKKKKSQSVGSKLLGMIGLGGDKNDSMQDVLGLIYRELQRAEEDKKLEKEQHENMLEGEEAKEDERNQELIEALTGKRHITGKKTGKKTKSEKNQKEKPYRDAKGRFAKKPKTTAEVEKNTAKTIEKTASKKSGSSILGSLFTPKAAAVAGAAVVGGVLLGSASDVIAKEEGVSTKGYWDPPNQKNLVSIGYGHQIQAAEYQQGFIQAGDEQIPIKGDKGIDTVMTKDQAKKLLAVDLPKYEKRAAAPLGDSWNKLNENQKTALISYTYNTGSTQSLVKAGLKEAIDSGDMKLAANIIREKGIKTAGGQYNKVLDERRQREAALFETAVKVQDKPAAVPTKATGDQIDSSSKENKDLKTPPKDAPAPVNVNTTNVNQTNTSKQSAQEKTEDDRPAPLKKSRG